MPCLELHSSVSSQPSWQPTPGPGERNEQQCRDAKVLSISRHWTAWVMVARPGLQQTDMSPHTCLHSCSTTLSFCGPLSQHHCHPAAPVPSLSPVPDSAHRAQQPHLACFSTCLLPFHWRPSPRPSTHPSGFIALLLSLRTPSYHPAGWRAERVVHCYMASRSSSGDSGLIPVGTPSPGCDELDCAASHPATGPPRATRGPAPRPRPSSSGSYSCPSSRRPAPVPLGSTQTEEAQTYDYACPIFRPPLFGLSAPRPSNQS